jgi:ubiquinone/menaquinone biosynthesis C-methylase UbiE
VTASSSEYFSEVASGWDELRADYFSESVRDKAISLSGARGRGIAADVGAGTGFMSEGLVNLGLNVIAVDESHEMLAEAKKKLESNPNVEFRLGSAEKIPIVDESVDYVFANMLLHHSDSPELAVREMSRITRSGGVVVLTDLDEHDAMFLRTEHHDRWMGFGRDIVRTWFQLAGLEDIIVTDIGENCCAKSESGEVAAVSIFAAVGRKPAHKIIK